MDYMQDARKNNPKNKININKEIIKPSKGDKQDFKLPPLAPKIG